MSRAVALLLGLCALAARAEQDLAPRDEARYQLALHAAAVKAVQDAAAMLPTNAAQSSAWARELAETMLADVPHHRKTGESRSRAEAWLKTRLDERFQGTLAAAATEASAVSPRPIAVGDVLAKIQPPWAERVETLARGSTGLVARLFQDARQEALERQRLALEQSAQTPKPEALNAQLNRLAQQRKPDEPLPAADFDGLSGWMAGQAWPKPPPLFEEAERFRKEAAQRLIERLRLAYNAQWQSLQDVAQEARIPARHLLPAEVQGWLAEQVAAAAGDPYPVLDVVLRATGPAATNAVRQRVERILQSAGALPALNEAEVEKALRTAPEQNLTAEQSRRWWMEQKADAARASFAAAYAQAAGRPAEAAQAATLVAAGGPGAELFQQRLAASLEAVLLPVRQRIADEAFAGGFPKWADEDPLAPDVIESLVDEQKEPWPDVSAWRSTVAGMPGLRLPDPVGPAAWEETLALGLAAANRKLALGREALDEQLRLLRDLESTRRDELLRDVAQDRPLDRILADWRKELTVSWKETNSVYSALFPRTEDQLNKTVRQLYDARKQEAKTVAEQTPRSGAEASPAQASATDARVDDFQADRAKEKADEAETAAEGKGETKQADALGLGEESYVWKVEPDAVLVVADGRWRHADVTVLGPDRTVLQKMSFRPDHVDDAAASIHDGLRDGLDRLLQQHVTAAPEGVVPPFKLFLFVQSREMRQLTSLRLRQKVQQQVDAWTLAHRPGQPPVELVWIVGL